jgi:gamma-glutamyltranspeptidase / glutathione hydrolase
MTRCHAPLYRHISVLIVSLLMFISTGLGQNAGELQNARHGMVVSASAVASQVGLDILKKGGNAVDAAIAVGFSLAVSYPSAGNLGGGCYIVVHMADGRSAAIDARETAPAAARHDMYLDPDGNAITELSLKGPLASGVPGSVDGFLKALKLFGTMSRPEIIAPAIRLANDGFQIHPRISKLFKYYKEDFAEFPSSRKIFSKADGSGYGPSELWRQPDLAATLQRISDRGRKGFYEGPTAELIQSQMNAGNGIIQLNDLAGYRSIVRRPVEGTFRDYTILSMPPSSSGGVVLLEMLNMLEHFPLREYGRTSALARHIIVEAMKRAFADRAEHLGDPAYHDVPMKKLLSSSYAKSLAAGIQMDTATASGEINSNAQPPKEGSQTTHYSVIDKDGNAVSVTTTLNSSFGAKCVVEGAGFLLNNEMDDFSIKPGVPNQYGLIGNKANAIEPGKRMLSSMTPVIVLYKGKPILLTGSPGGSRIITTVLHVLLNALEFGLAVDEAIEARRYHHQWLPDEIVYEEGAFSTSEIKELQLLGHTLRSIKNMGRAEGIFINPTTGIISGSSDSRGYGAALGY